MRTLHAYILRQSLVTLALSVAICTFVLLLGNALKDVLVLLVSGQASIAIVVKAFGLLIPYVLAFALPVGFLAATLLTFGRLSADNELTAMRASGISLLSVAAPLIVASAVFAVICAFVNLELAPKCRVAFKNLFVQYGVSRGLEFLQEGRIIDDIPGITIYIDKRNGTELRGVWFYEHNKNAAGEWELVRSASAARADLLIDLTNRNLSLKLHQALILQRIRAPSTNAAQSRSLDWQPIQADFETPNFALENFSIREPKLSEMSYWELREKISQLEKQGIPTTPAKVQLHRQLSFSFASFAFALIGIPLGIRAHRKETSIGIGLALILLLVYYSFFILGESLQARAELRPHLIQWLPNVIFQFIGGALLWRANRGV